MPTYPNAEENVLETFNVSLRVRQWVLYLSVGITSDFLLKSWQATKRLR